MNRSKVEEGGSLRPDRADGPKYILALDSSTALGTVAVGTAEGVLAEISLSVRSTHSSTLLPAIDHALTFARLAPSDLSAVVVGAGPGSFTGLRIAAATAKGIRASLGLPMMAYSTLLALAARASGGTGTVCAVLDARGRDVYAATYRFGAEIDELQPPTATTVDALLDHLGGFEHIRVVGDGGLRHRLELEGGSPARVVPPHLATPSAAALVWLATAWPGKGIINDPGGWEPTYLRASGAERIAAARSGGVV